MRASRVSVLISEVSFLCAAFRTCSRFRLGLRLDLRITRAKNLARALCKLRGFCKRGMLTGKQLLFADVVRASGFLLGCAALGLKRLVRVCFECGNAGNRAALRFGKQVFHWRSLRLLRILRGWLARLL